MLCEVPLMTLIGDVKDVLDRLAPRGWATLLMRHGLDITAPASALEAELARPLTIDTTAPGFQEMALDTIRAIEPGIPGRSLLYHALASADVTPGASATADDFPTLAELDTVENYVYATARRKLNSFSSPVIAVVAYQYRPLRLSVHRRHADLAFSRTGISRVGTEAARYDASLRSFDPRPVGGDRGFAVTPARFAAFIAELRSPGPNDAVLRSVSVDGTLQFAFPVHKLFPGKECLFAADGTPLNLTGLGLVETHVNEKLRRIHLAAPDNPGRVAPLAQFDISKPPFVRTTADSNDLVKLQKVGASVLVVPVRNPIVRTATQGTSGGGSELVRFKVPRANANNRFWTSLQLPSTPNGRAAPEYANIRQVVTPRPGGGFRIEDLNQRPNGGTAAAERFDKKLQVGGYEAAHFIDGTCDGVISMSVPAALGALRVLPAYSLVSAVDYFPGVEQVEIEEWVERVQGEPVGLGDSSFQFEQGGPRPLSDGRFVASTTGGISATRRIPNTRLTDPASSAGTPAFPPTEPASRTATALVGRRSTAATSTALAGPRFGSSWLPDAASDVFAPGWDVSQHAAAGQSFYAAYGLGSPFPEDAKLCAALNSFWPAAAPDSSRTYGFFADSSSLLPTAIPLTDRELGYHASHPRVAAGEVPEQLGWDGGFGPFFETVAGARFVNAADIHRSDQTRAAFDGDLGFSGLDAITAAEMILRMDELRSCRTNVLTPNGFSPSWLIAVERVPDWSGWTSTVWPKLNAALAGDGLIFVFALVDPTPQPVGDPPLRSHYTVNSTVQVQLSKSVLFFQIDEGPVRRINR
jgi:hypothetical protein